jgi:hypothetical protein
VVALVETITRPPHAVLKGAQETGSGAVDSTYTFPTGMWQFESAMMFLYTTDASTTMEPSQVGCLIHCSNDGSFIEAIPSVDMGRYRAEEWMVTFQGSLINFVAGDTLEYNNFDISSSGTAAWNFYVQAMRLR